MMRKQLFQEVEQLMKHYCDGCFLHEHIKTNQGRRKAHRFCIKECTVGEKIKSYGNRLS
ncbi:zinc-finger domain-containing protein [Bacillus sp. DNRA2]|uniref:zinc-finger domain-containing protein n=1 Tax=Bacillus sp. DNRA2 TaxID=2723053 RepID=UPI00145F3302|nr:zinc-finger domain-containing protein [Bacillus sp. DNRA2]NMD72462.1 zinc-finger domain-containing protein [Bacillus sp. DNRA2]